MLETPPPAARTSGRQRSRFGRLGDHPSVDRFSNDLAMLDEVTGLRDSRCLWKELAQRSASCSKSSPLAVVVVDFDRFHDVNEHYDRSIGDAVLRRCAKVAAEEAPSARLAFRYRDDELVLLVPGDEEDGRELAERVRAQIAAQNNNLPAVTVSCGVAVLHSAVEPIVALGKAGPALQAAKNSGGNRVVVATETDRNGHNGHNGNGNGDGDGGESAARRAALAMAVASLEARDRATAAHSDDVVTLCESIGTRLGLSDLQLDRLTAAAQLHDVGKLAMPTEILNKRGPLNDEEWQIIREHTVIGERMLRAVPEMGAVANMVRHSHERWDGSGYPDGLAGEEIPLASRIILCADAFHAIRSDRPYRPGRSADEALTEVRRYAGEQFDPRVVEALVAIARDIRRANGSGISLPRSRRLAAMLAALAVFGGGSAYAASENVRHVVDEVVKAVGPGYVLQAAEAEAGSPDFALRPIDQVSQIIPVSILTPDLELAPFREAPPSYRGSPAESAIGDSVIAFVDEPAAAEDLVTGSAPAVEELRPPATLIPAVPISPAPPLSTPVPAVSPDATTPALVPVENVEPDADDEGNPHGEPPAVGNPHGGAPGQDNEQDPPPAEILPTPPPLVEITPPPEQPSEPAEEPEDDPEPPPDEEGEPPPIPPIREEQVASEESAAIPPESYVPEIPAIDATKPDADAAEPVITETPTTE